MHAGALRYLGRHRHPGEQRRDQPLQAAHRTVDRGVRPGIATNLRPVFITSRQLVLHRQQNGNRSYGRIINLCSTRYLQSEAGTEAYSASKGGIYSLTHSLAVSLAPFHITVNAIAPGWIHVREEEQLRPEDHAFHPSGRVGTPEDIARACLFLCDEANDFLNGQTLTIDGGATIRMIYPE